jgi:tetratricopeptide (TPR) repeat protein
MRRPLRFRSAARLRAIALAAATLAASVPGLHPGSAWAQDNDASAHFERGMTFFKDGDYVAAMVEFKKAYEIDPNYRGLYNLGQTSKELRDYAASLDSFERYLAEGGSEIDPERKKKVEGWVAELREKIGRVTLTTNVPGAEITVDDVLVGKTPLAKPVTMNAGRRRVVVTKDGYAPLTRFIDVAGTETKTLALDLASLSSGGGGGGGGGKVIEVEHTPWPWVGLGVTGALGIATGVVGGLALGKKSTFDDALTTFPASTQVIEEAREDARRFALAADILGGVTGAAAVLTIVAFAVDYGRSAGEPESPPEKKAAAHVIVAPGFVGVSGSF